jgi:hypothetical protein
VPTTRTLTVRIPRTSIDRFTTERTRRTKGANSIQLVAIQLRLTCSLSAYSMNPSRSSPRKAASTSSLASDQNGRRSE